MSRARAARRSIGVPRKRPKVDKAAGGSLPLTNDGRLYSLRRRYAVAGDPVTIAWVHRPGGDKGRARGEPWIAVLESRGGSTDAAGHVLTTELVAIDE